MVVMNTRERVLGLLWPFPGCRLHPFNKATIVDYVVRHSELTREVAEEEVTVALQDLEKEGRVRCQSFDVRQPKANTNNDTGKNTSKQDKDKDGDVAMSEGGDDGDDAPAAVDKTDTTDTDKATSAAATTKIVVYWPVDMCADPKGDKSPSMMSASSGPTSSQSSEGNDTTTTPTTTTTTTAATTDAATDAVTTSTSSTTTTATTPSKTSQTADGKSGSTESSPANSQSSTAPANTTTPATTPAKTNPLSTPGLGRGRGRAKSLKRRRMTPLKPVSGPRMSILSEPTDTPEPSSKRGRGNGGGGALHRGGGAGGGGGGLHSSFNSPGQVNGGAIGGRGRGRGGGSGGGPGGASVEAWEYQLFHLQKLRHKLGREASAKTSELNQLKLARTMAENGEIERLHGLVEKWTAGCQEMLNDLYAQNTSTEPITMMDMLNALNIPPQLVRYSAEAEDFV